MTTTDTYVHRLKAGATGAPILFAFHGTGGDENQFFDFAARLLPQATIVSPRGDVSEKGATRFFRRSAEGVYDMEDLARATGKMAAYVRQLKEQRLAGPVLGFGFSNGANILANVLIEHGGLFDAAGLLHPLIPFEPKDNPSLDGTRVLITAGRQDPICPPPYTDALDAYFRAQGARTTLEWHPGGHDIRQNEIAALQALFSPYAGHA